MLGISEPEPELLPSEIYQEVRPNVWANGTRGKAKTAQPIQMPLKENTAKANLKQYLLKQEAQRGIQPIFKKFLEAGLTRPCQSPYNIPVLPVKNLTPMSTALSKTYGPSMKWFRAYTLWYLVPILY